MKVERLMVVRITVEDNEVDSVTDAEIIIECAVRGGLFDTESEEYKALSHAEKFAQQGLVDCAEAIKKHITIKGMH